jgi:hypothetical protein
VCVPKGFERRNMLATSFSILHGNGWRVKASHINNSVCRKPFLFLKQIVALNQGYGVISFLPAISSFFSIQLIIELK